MPCHETGCRDRSWSVTQLRTHLESGLARLLPPIPLDSKLHDAVRRTRIGASGEEEEEMLFMLALLFMTAWILGLVTGYAFGGLLHFLLFLAFVAMIARVLHRKTT